MKKTKKSTNNNIKKYTKNLSRKKINKIIKVNFKLTTKYRTYYDFDVKECFHLKNSYFKKKWKIVDILPNKIINYIKSIKYKIVDYFYDTYVCNDSPLTKYKSFYNPYRITFFSKNKILSVYFIIPKNTSYENIKKILRDDFEDESCKSHLGIGNDGISFYKLNNKVYHIDFDLHDFELIHNNSTIIYDKKKTNKKYYAYY